jgi:hypothetical protein
MRRRENRKRKRAGAKRYCVCCGFSPCFAFNQPFAMSKLTEQIPAIAITVLLLGGLGGAGAYYVTHTVLPEMEARRAKEITELKEQHAKETQAAKDENLKKIAELNKLLSEAAAKREADMFRTQEELAKLNTERMDALAEAIAKKVQPFNPLPKTPEEAERTQNEQVDKVSARLNERIQPILAQMARDQGNLTRDSLAGYSQKISDQISGVLTTELAKNAQLNANLQSTQAVARESLALSHELGALYLSSFKDQGVITRILTLPANVLKDASQISILNSSEKKKKETELLARMADVQKRLDAELAKAPVK